MGGFQSIMLERFQSTVKKQREKEEKEKQELLQVLTIDNSGVKSPEIINVPGKIQEQKFNRLPDCVACIKQLEIDEDKNRPFSSRERRRRIRKAQVSCVTCCSQCRTSPLRMTDLCLSCNMETHGMSGNHPWKHHRGFSLIGDRREWSSNGQVILTYSMESFSKAEDILHRNVEVPFFCNCVDCKFPQ
jgi:hypothetical protein